MEANKNVNTSETIKKIKGTNLSIMTLYFGENKLYCLINSNTHEFLSPLLKSIEYSEEERMFYIEDYVELEDESLGKQRVNIYYNMSDDLKLIGIPFNDYFDAIGGSFDFSKYEGAFDKYINFKYTLMVEVIEDKKKRIKKHKDNQRKLSYVKG